MVLINKMERDNANFIKAVASIQEYSDVRLIPVQIPWGEKADFQGVIDILKMKAYKGNSASPVEIPAGIQMPQPKKRAPSWWKPPLKAMTL